MNFVFRADASLTIGTGHVMRCLTLAQSLRKRNTTVSFVCREHEGHLCGLIERNGFAVSRLPAPVAGSQFEDGPVHASWLGASWQTDAAQTRAAIEATGAQPQWLIVDHYALDQRWESALRTAAGRIMVIDDLADRMHDCDLLLDQNLVAQMHARYAGKTPAACDRLLGPAYALLQPAYAGLHGRIPPRAGPLRRILISFGGVDRANLTAHALAACLRAQRTDIEVDVVVNAASPHLTSIRKQAAAHGNVHLHSDLPSLAPLMVKADLAIGAAGATSWERLCVGLPSLVVTLAENQRPIAEELHRRGLVCWLGNADAVDETTIEDALRKLLQQGLPEDWSSHCLATVDGNGSERVCAALTLTAGADLQARHALLRDEAMLAEWTAAPAAAANFRSAFRAGLRNLDGCRDYIVETADGVPVGQVRCERADAAWEIARSVAPGFRGRAIDCAIAKAALLRLRADVGGALTIVGVKSCTGAAGNASRPWRIGLCSDAGSWINATIADLLLDWLAAGHRVTWAHDAADLPAGDMCFYLSYGRIVEAGLLRRHKNNLVVHASDVPKGRGWSPLTWQILESRNRIPVSLLEAAEAVDSGPVYKQITIEFAGGELIDELRNAVAGATRELCRYFVDEYPAAAATAVPQRGEPTHYARRRPQDSELDVDRSLREQFNLLRTVDAENYPAWFTLGNTRFALKIEKLDINPTDNAVKNR